MRIRRFSDQITTFKRIQLYRDGIPRSFRTDEEYNGLELLRFCATLEIKLIGVPANFHEGNRTAESANRTLRSYFNCFALAQQLIDIIELEAAATFHINTCRGHNATSSFNVIYDRVPCLSTICNSINEGSFEDSLLENRQRQFQLILEQKTPNHPLLSLTKRYSFGETALADSAQES